MWSLDITTTWETWAEFLLDTLIGILHLLRWTKNQCLSIPAWVEEFSLSNTVDMKNCTWIHKNIAVKIMKWKMWILYVVFLLGYWRCISFQSMSSKSWFYFSAMRFCNSFVGHQLKSHVSSVSHFYCCSSNHLK